MADTPATTATTAAAKETFMAKAKKHGAMIVQVGVGLLLLGGALHFANKTAQR